MKKIVLPMLTALLQVMCSAVIFAQVSDPVLSWQTFLGGENSDRGCAVALDGSGNAYVAGFSYNSWGSPVAAYGGGASDGLVAKFDSSGTMLWHTFLGGGGADRALAIAVDTDGNIYVTGYSFLTWGSPINGFGGGYSDGFAAKLDSNGSLLWSTFFGGSSGDIGYAVALDSAATPHFSGLSGASWGTPVTPYAAKDDAYVVKLNVNGGRIWNTFLGGSGNELAQGLVISSAGVIALTGRSSAEWGLPIRAYSAGEDGFVAALDATGNLLWNTFLGGSGSDQGYGIASNSANDFLIVGASTTASWGSPINPYTGLGEAFVVKIAADGNLAWNTFLGGDDNDYGYGIDLDANGNIYITGFCAASWGSPLQAHSGVEDLFIAALTPDGLPSWHTYFGAGGYEDGRGIALDHNNNSILVAGFCNATWGTPLNAFAGGYDAFLLKLIPCHSITIVSPNGGESWTVGESHDITWTSTGTIASANIDYLTNSGGDWIPVVAGTANDGTYSWTIPNTPSTTCLVRVRDAADNDPSDSSDAVFTIAAAVTETVSTPNTPSGPETGLISTSYDYSTGGSTSNLGHSIQYKFDWDDGTDSDWLAEGTTEASHSWAAAGTYDVRAMARCAEHTSIESLWSETLAVIITDGAASGAYNSPAQYKVLPEVIWASATGGGTWVSEVQLTDVTGGSQVYVYYNTLSGRRGPFLLWNNSGGAALSSSKFSNLLQTIDGLDTEVFTYYGTVGAVEFVTQDGSHLLHAAVRELNGNYAKTFTGLSLHDANTATTGRAMIVSNLSSNATYRTTVGFFNPTADSIIVEFTLLDSSGAQIGTPFSKTLAGHEFQAFDPFAQAGVPYPGSSYDSVILRVRPTSGAGKLMCFGATANNVSNDPAAHVAVQGTTGYDNGPGSSQVLPEVIWAPATGGGTWVSEVQLTDVTGGSQVSVYYNTLSGRRGPFLLWNNSGGALSSIQYANLLETIDGLDTEVFTYYGTVGSVEFVTQDGSHLLQAAVRELNGNYAKTFSGLNLVDAETADTARAMLIQNFTNNSNYRSTAGFFNPTSDPVTVEFTLLDSGGAQIGSPFNKTLAGHEFQAFDPFTWAGVPYPGSSYDNVILRVRPTSGAGEVMCFGATANNTSNDPASHLAVQAE